MRGREKVPNNKLYKFYSILFKYIFYSIFIHFLFSKAPHQSYKLTHKGQGERKCEEKYKNIQKLSRERILSSKYGEMSDKPKNGEDSREFHEVCFL
jgi:hypothetical protein